MSFFFQRASEYENSYHLLRYESRIELLPGADIIRCVERSTQLNRRYFPQYIPRIVPAYIITP